MTEAGTIAALATWGVPTLAAMGILALMFWTGWRARGKAIAVMLPPLTAEAQTPPPVAPKVENAPAPSLTHISLEPPDYQNWDAVERFDIATAAALWIRETPTRAYMTVDALAIHRAIKQDIEDGNMKVVEMNGEKPNVKTIVTRDELKAFAKRKKLRTPFLHKKERSQRI